MRTRQAGPESPSDGGSVHVRSTHGAVAPWIGLGVTLLLMVAAVVVPIATDWDVHVRGFPPLHARVEPRLGPGSAPVILLAIAAALTGVGLARRLRWGWLLVVAFAAALAWMVCLALVDGLDGIGVILNHRYEYLNTAREVTDFPAVLREYVSRIPIDAPDNWPVHIAGHPPGALLFFVVLVRLGLDTGLAAGFAVIVVAATTPVAVLVLLRRLGAEEAARRAAPFLAMGTAAIWMGVSGDAVFGAFGAWGACLLAVGATAGHPIVQAGWSIAAGLVLGYSVMMSYGLPLLGVVAVAVLVLARDWRPLPWAAGAALAVVLAFAAFGFAWWEAYPVLVERYWAGIASDRPGGYWTWGDLAAFAFSAGPIVGAAAAVALVRIPRLRALPRWELVAVVLTLAALGMVLLADLSQMSRAEVERIWLPFVPWALVGTALLSEGWRRWGFAAQLGCATVFQHVLSTGW